MFCIVSRLVQKSFRKEMADCTYTNSCSSNQAKKNLKNKQFRWTDKMVSQLIECLAAYKSKMEYQNKDFDANRPVR